MVRIQRNFLWGGSAEDKKMCWVKWAQVCLPKEKGGLGVRDLDMFNLALLSKWKWRCIDEKHALWYDLLQFRYGPLSIKILSREAVITGPKDSLWWRDVVGVGGKDEDCWFPSQVSSRVGNGKTISFWKEKWFGATPLRDLFPSLFAKELHKDCVVSDIIQLDIFKLNWTRDWLTSLTHAESVEKAELEHLLFGLVLQSDIADRWRWNTAVTVAEDCNHLFFSCNKVTELWRQVCLWLGCDYNLQEVGCKHFLSFGLIIKSKKGKKVRHLIWLATTWCLWRTRNNILFRGDKADFSALLDQIRFISWLWFGGRAGRKAGYSYSNWCINPLCCLQSF
ncbi:uncharacterized protein LOC123904464 [Trifolium pratense]|uniref:uncharacterized protein LOC123904464 n=1 Tax=Trifolium pratense TaxID=57577 RepID=UPI001E691E50|nr:uncharacterized protein LOC123904464 [Trifolium pratense]